MLIFHISHNLNGNKTSSPPQEPTGPVLPDPFGDILCFRVADPNCLLAKAPVLCLGWCLGWFQPSLLCVGRKILYPLIPIRAPSSKPCFFPISSANDSCSAAIPNILLQPGRLAGVIKPLLKPSNGFKRCILVFCSPHCVWGHPESLLKRVWADLLPVDLGRGCIPNFSMPPTPLLGCQGFKAIHGTITG